MSTVFVLDRQGRPLMPTHPARARQLLRQGRAVVHRRVPFVIRLRERTGGEVQPVRLKISPGSQVTGLALVREGQAAAQVLHLAELRHKRGIWKKLLVRRANRRRRRSRLRYRPPRFANRRRPAGWLPPTLQSRVDHITAWVARYRRLAPVSAISVQLSSFDMKRLAAAETGAAGDGPELSSRDIRRSLRQVWGNRCAYCGRTGLPLEIEHIVPRSRGGTSRLPNLTLACRRCNQIKGNRTAAEFGYPEVQARTQRPLREAALVNSTRTQVYKTVLATGLAVEVGTGKQTAANRARLGWPKGHVVNALCVGASTPAAISGVEGARVLIIQARGRGQYRRTLVDRYSFPRGYLMRQKMVAGFRSGDLVRAVVPQGRYAGRHEGVVSVTKVGRFTIRRGGQIAAAGIHFRHISLLQRGDGYGYEWEEKSGVLGS